MAWTQKSLDTFDDTALTALASHTPNVGSGWSVDSGSWRVDATGAKVEQVDAVEAYARNTTTLGDKQAVEITLNDDFTAYGLLARWASGSGGSGYRLYLPGGEIRLYRQDSGTPTLINTYSVATGAGDVIRLECDGSSLTVLKNGSIVGGPETDATYASGYGAMYVNGAGSIREYAAYDEASGPVLTSGTYISPFGWK